MVSPPGRVCNQICFSTSVSAFCKSWFPQGEPKTFLRLCLSLLELNTPSFIIYSHSPVSWRFTTRQFNIENQSWCTEKLITKLLLNAKLCSCISPTSNYQWDSYAESCVSQLFDASVKARGLCFCVCAAAVCALGEWLGSPHYCN